MKRALVLLIVLSFAIPAPASAASPVPAASPVSAAGPVSVAGPVSAAGPVSVADPVSVAVQAPAAGARDGHTAGGHRWQWPVEGPRAIARLFIAPPTPYSAGHRGADLRAGTDAVLAPAGGVVHFAGVVVDRPVLSIRHPGGLISSFEPVSTPLRAGDAVVRGQLIGTLHPGHCSSLCLHFGVRLQGQYVNPLLLLGGVPRAVLLPTR